MRYHKKVYWPEQYKTHLEVMTNTINLLSWRYTSHVLDNIKNRTYDLY